MGRTHINLAPANWLLEFRELLNLKNLAHHEIADDTATDRLYGLDLKAGSNQALSDVATRLIGRNGNEFT
jgi:hypothetical protein